MNVVAIRTNSEETDLEVNAPLDTVHHYDDLKSLNVTAIKGASYHEYGTVKGNAIIASGRLVVEKDGVVPTIIVDNTNKATGATAAPEVKASTGSEVGTIVVNTVSTGTKVEVETGADVSAVAAGNETAKAAMATVAEDVPAAIIEENVVDTSKTSLFEGGLGTEASPYLISNKAQFENINSLSNDMGNGKSLYFVQTADIDLGEYENADYIIGNFRGVYEGDNHVLVAPNGLNPHSSEKCRRLICCVLGTSTFKNIELHLKDELVLLTNSPAGSYSNITLDNFDIIGQEGTAYDPVQTNTGFFFQTIGLTISLSGQTNWLGYSTVTIKNSDVDANMNSTQNNNAVFVGGMLYRSTLTVDNCSYKGTFTGKNVSFVVGNSTYYNGYVTVRNSQNLGTIIGTTRAAFIGGTQDFAYKTSTNNDEGIIAKVDDNDLAISQENGYFKIKEGKYEGATYQLQLVGGMRVTSGNQTQTSGGSQNSSYAFTIDLGELEFEEGYCITEIPTKGKLATIAQYHEFVDANKDFDNEAEHYTTAGEKFYIVTKDGNIYFVFDFDNPEIYFAVRAQDNSRPSAIISINTANVFEYSNDLLKGMATCSAK